LQIEVHLFSILRDCLPPGSSGGSASVTLLEGATLADLVRHLGIDRYLRCQVLELTTELGWQVMVAGKFELDLDRPLRDGDKVHIFPPVSGG
jgi:molybdopterin converting factor small subunit